ncbi:MAG: N-acyl-D-amino-acid deacylase family protein [Novosphingobium sp.]|jgi:N-acyl-D-amino-acid deacylase|uniref:N-acyl-D-amino-acid deacylase family protein n=1 Tax=Novosphingobium sp. TaxID=1874826 RepID=UPI003918C4B9|nr:amidohydrolase family protein [Novosphingobium sp.]
MYDTIIRQGRIYDGLGGQPYVGDIAFSDGIIQDIGPKVAGVARHEIGAQGAIITPGWIDVHTHYDGQISWDSELAPSSHNGTTTVVMGNCGVGFAPVRPGQEQALIELMEGVEDIPGTALYEGIEWGRWESFPEYLDYIASREYAIDVAAQIAHGAVRYYAMGERGRTNADATAEEIGTIADLVEQAIAAGAVGFSTSRTIGHRALWGEPVPGTFAAEDELLEIARRFRKLGKGVIEAIPAGAVGELAALGGERNTPQGEFELLRKCSETSGRPLTFTLVETRDYYPELWRDILAWSADANRAGAQLYPQVPSRIIGYLHGLSSYHAFMRTPTYLDKLAALPVAERAAAMRVPEIKAAIMSEKSIPHEAPGSMEHLAGVFRANAALLYPIADPINLEAGPECSIGHLAGQAGQEPLDYLYDFTVAGDGTHFASFSRKNLPESLAVIGEMLRHPETVTGLSDAGAHVTLICDATMPTTQLSYWTRDRAKGERIPIEFLVHKQTARNAALYGFGDRGSLQVGKRADINVIDYDRLNAAPPVAFRDLPAGGTRIMQPVTGYRATFCNGVMIRENDSDTGARPGRLVRS